VDARILKEEKATDHRVNQLLMKCNTLRRWIDRWKDVQAAYMPSVAEYRAESISPDDACKYFENPETIPLHLPSALPTDIASTIPSNFFVIETWLRISQVDDSLNDLKRFLRVTMGLWDYKHTNIGPSQRSSTHMHVTINTFREKVIWCAERYRAARSALSVLDPGGTWAIRLQELKPTDIRPPIRDMDKAPKPKQAHNDARTDPEASEGRRTISWIWLASCPVATGSGGDENMQKQIGKSESQNCPRWSIKLIVLRSLNGMGQVSRLDA
jgi:hypothetical protein